MGGKREGGREGVRVGGGVGGVGGLLPAMVVGLYSYMMVSSDSTDHDLRWAGNLEHWAVPAVSERRGGERHRAIRLLILLIWFYGFY